LRNFNRFLKKFNLSTSFLIKRTYEIWCGENDGVINVFTVNDSGVSDHHRLSHFESSLPSKGLYVAKLYASNQHVYSYVAPSCVLYQWSSLQKTIENKLDCSKLIPCSESMKSIQIDEHLSPGKCQISSLAVMCNELYIGTTWGCLIIVEKATLRPITVFRPFEEDVSEIVQLFLHFSHKIHFQTAYVDYPIAYDVRARSSSHRNHR
jgi:hypothetical protein